MTGPNQKSVIERGAQALPSNQKSQISRLAAFACALIGVAILAWLVLPGLRWGLPSEERNRLTMGADRSEWHAPKMPDQEKNSPWLYYPNNLAGGPARTGQSPRSAFNPVRSYHPDEYVFLKSLSGMRPSELKFFHGFFGWPALQFYVSGVALKLASWFRAVALKPDIDFYFQHPEEIAKLYEVGRIVTLLFAAGCILAVWRAAGRLFGPAGGNAAALLLAVTPLFTINARYWTADVPMLFWMSLALLFSTHILAGGGRKWYVLAGIALGLAAATRYQGGAAAFVIAAAHWLRPDDDVARAISPRSGKIARPTSSCFVSKNLWLAAMISLAVFLACNPYILARPGQFVQEFSGELAGSHVGWAHFTFYLALSFVTGLGVIFSLAILAASWLAVIRRDRAISFVLLGFGLPAVILFVGRPAMARYWMPVLLLPVLLVAWAFAAMRRRGIERRKRGARFVTPILLLVVLFATGLQSFTFGHLFTDPRYDTRTRAGEWIAHQPAGSAIEVVSEPWQFELPPMDSRKFKIIVADDPNAAGFEPDYFVFSDMQGRMPIPDLATISRRDWWMLKLKDRDRPPVFGLRSLEYTEVQRFEAWPSGWFDSLPLSPQDMRYTSPFIMIAKPYNAKGGR